MAISIEFENVWFAYKDEEWVLKGISFALNQGETLALVGTTGSGKTTIVNLLLRFYPIQRGTIRINGIDIQEYTLKELRQHFSIVLQDPVIFSDTIFNNITLGLTHIQEREVKQAIAFANLERFVAKFTEGISHKLSPGQISTGEMQLLSIARAVAQRREIFLLDEATANVDYATEQLIQNAYDKLFVHKTALVIAHRLRTVQKANQILVLHHGNIAEKGTHQQLLQLNGLYEKLYRLQFLNT